jgi:serine/threonine protein kinase
MEVGDFEVGNSSPCPFSNLQRQDSSVDAPDDEPKQPILWRTQSLDDEAGWRRRMPMQESRDENQDNDSSVATALHSSFDASLLNDDGESSIFRSAGKHARNASSEEQDVVAPGTVRKLQRRSDLPPGPNKHTPGRHGHYLRKGSACAKINMMMMMGDRTPTSAARRRRNTHAQRRSPRLQSMSRFPPSATPFKFQETTATTTSPATPRVSLFDTNTTMQPMTTNKPPLTPTRAFKAMTTVRKATCQTATTVNSSFDGGLNDDSHETASPTPFRFTSFPASLPRVNNTRNNRSSHAMTATFPPPTTTRKRMTFSALAENDGKSSNSSSREEDATNNSSLSSLSAEAQQQQQQKPCLLPWKSPGGDLNTYRRRLNSNDSDAAQETRFGVAASPVHARLFCDDEAMQDVSSKVKFECSNNPAADIHSKQVRYVFGKESGNDDDDDVDLSHPYEQRKTNSFPSTDASSTTPLRNISTFEDGTIDSGMTPSRHGGMNMPESSLSPEQQVKFHFHVDASQCSPIPGIPEEEEDVDRVPHAMRMVDDTDGQDYEMSHKVAERPPRSSPRKRLQRRSGSQSSSRKGCTPSKESSKLSLSNESGDSGSTTASSKQRRLRPMPDMNAFDAGVSTRSASSSRNDKSTDESSGGIMMVPKAAPPSPQLVCPPTPQRTPAWASYNDEGPHQKFSRQNSLIATKVLATCPSQVLDGHSSLENSLMDDDHDDDDDDEEESIEPQIRKPSIPFLAVAEEMEEEEQESPIREWNGLGEMVTYPVSSASLLPRHQRGSFGPAVENSSMLPPPVVASRPCSGRATFGDDQEAKLEAMAVKAPASPRLSSGSFGGVGTVISFSSDFDNLGKLGSGAFADVFKVRSRSDQQLYAVKRNRRHFRGKRDREMALAEVRIMQRLQSVCAQSGTSSDKKEKAKNSYSLYLLFFLRAWQEDGHFFCQTELCCRDTCREMKITLGTLWPMSQKKYLGLLRYFPVGNDADGNLIPESTVWKICHDVAAGLSHIHSHGVVHNDIKSSNIFMVAHNRLGALVKIGDFGMAGDIGTSEDGQEGDTSYMAPELLSSGMRHPSSDIFSLGLTLYELASNLSWELPSEGPRWQELRQGSHSADLPISRSPALGQLIQAMLKPDPTLRPSADVILDQVPQVKIAGSRCEEFLRDYIKDIEAYDRVEEERLALERREADERGQTPRNAHGKGVVRARDLLAGSPPPSIMAPAIFTPEPAAASH